jgi:NAD(P)-dependent dehydrogenase (short-subunit alcohol dehydrogenase family)
LRTIDPLHVSDANAKWLGVKQWEFLHASGSRASAIVSAEHAAMSTSPGATARWAGEGIAANALMPGAIATNLQQWS